MVQATSLSHVPMQLSTTSYQFSGEPTDQPTDQPTDRPTDQPTDWPTNWPTTLITQENLDTASWFLKVDTWTSNY